MIHQNMTDFYLKKTLLPIMIIGMVILFTSCNEDCNDNSNISDQKVVIKYTPLENQLRSTESVDDLTTLLSSNRAMSDYFLHAEQYPSDTILASRMYRQVKDLYMDTLFTQTEKKFNDMPKLVSQMEKAYQRIKYYYPNAKIPRLQTMVTGFYNDLYISDSLIIIGLDYFVGKDGSYKPNDIPNYILKRYEKENLLPIVFTFISNNYNKGDFKHNSLLADMINLGKSYYFVSQILPCTDESLIIGYDKEEWKLVIENQEVIWANLIENEMLYETEDFMKNKFIGERPNIPEINEKCPGRIGAWVGWEIVKAYMENNPSVSLQELMDNRDAHTIFQQAKYRPKNVK